MRKIKKYLLIIPVLFSLLYCFENVDAASAASISISSATVGKNVTVKVTVSNVNAVDLTATISGAGTSGNIRLVDGSMSGSKKSFSGSRTVKPTSTGTITVTISSSSNATRDGAYVDVSGSKTATVKAASSTSGSSGGTTSTTDTRSKVNTLSSLTVSQGTISPSFSADKTEYNIDLPNTVTEVTIEAKSTDSKAKVSGTGKKTVKVGSNTFDVVCTAENGSKKTYKLIFHVDETPLVYTTYNDVNLGVVRNLEGVEIPSGFKESKIQLDSQEITGYTNETLKMSIAYLVNESGDKSFYIIDEGKVTGTFVKLTIGSKDYYSVTALDDLLDVQGLTEKEVEINGVKYQGWSYPDSDHENFTILYLMDANGITHLYSYEATEGTLQLYIPSSSQSSSTLTYLFLGTTVVFALLSVGLFIAHHRFKNKSISAIKEYYDKKHIVEDVIEEELEQEEKQDLL